MAQDRPVHEVRLGKVKAAIWRNETDSGPRYSVTLSRIYKTDKGWESSFSFGRDELPLVEKVANMAHTWIYQQNEKAESPSSETSNDSKPAGGRREKAGSR
jgi:hypothetical protein